MYLHVEKAFKMGALSRTYVDDSVTYLFTGNVIGNKRMIYCTVMYVKSNEGEEGKRRRHIRIDQKFRVSRGTVRPRALSSECGLGRRPRFLAPQTPRDPISSCACLVDFREDIRT